MNEPILLSTPHMGDRELDFVKEAFETNWIAPIGPHVDAFEQEFCEAIKSDYSAAVSSGTAALHLALRLVGVKEGDEVLCSTLTFIASANPIVYLGAKPIFLDCDRHSWNLDPNVLETTLKQKAAEGKLPKALVLVHLYGQSADLDPIVELCNQYEVPLIEDAAEALGATYKGKSPGTFGKIGIFSFNGNKIITTSGGGMLVSPHEELMEKARFWATQARDPFPHYQHSELGYNYRLSNVLAAIGRGQLLVLKDRVAARRKNFQTYEKALSEIPGLEFMPEAEYGVSNRWLTCLTIDPKIAKCDREHLRVELAKKQIETRPVWKPLHLQPIFDKCESVEGKVAEELFNNGLCLPSGSNLSEESIQRVVEEISKIML